MLLSQDPVFVKKMQQLQADLPIYVDLIKDYRGCLYKADDKSDAIDCQKKATEKAEKNGLQAEDVDDRFSDNLGQWSPSEKNQYIKALNQDIKDWEIALPCIQNAKNPVAIFNCTNFSKE